MEWWIWLIGLGVLLWAGWLTVSVKCIISNQVLLGGNQKKIEKLLTPEEEDKTIIT